MTESRFGRWSRKKQEMRQEEQTPPVKEVVESQEEDELTINESLPEEEVLAKYDLPNPDNIELGTDITGFMNKEIPEFLRRKALRSLWRSNPVLHVLDGLNDYDEDYTDAAFAGQVVNTVYKVGEGMFKKVKQVDESLEALQGQAIESADTTVSDTEPQSISISEGEILRGSKANESGESLAQIQAAIDADNEKVTLERDNEEVPVYQYKPRMKFESR